MAARSVSGVRATMAVVVMAAMAREIVEADPFHLFIKNMGPNECRVSLTCVREEMDLKLRRWIHTTLNEEEVACVQVDEKDGDVRGIFRQESEEGKLKLEAKVWKKEQRNSEMAKMVVIAGGRVQTWHGEQVESAGKAARFVKPKVDDYTWTETQPISIFKHMPIFSFSYHTQEIIPVSYELLSAVPLRGRFPHAERDTQREKESFVLSFTTSNLQLSCICNKNETKTLMELVMRFIALSMQRISW